MIKHINPQNILNSPFVAVKSRALSNTDRTDYVLEEDDVTGIALEYIDYNDGDPILNTSCNIALEQQATDTLGYEEGVTGSRFFNTASAPLNMDGTYKELVYRVIKNSFYNTYQNPTEIFGVENIDFPLSNTLRNLADQFRMFSIPQIQMGDKIRPQSLEFYDNLLDDNVQIFDDGYQNLIAGYNLFSKIQEVRIYPSGSNPQIIFPGTKSFFCAYYDMLFVTNPTNISASVGTNVTFSVSGSGSPRPLFYQWFSGSVSSSYVQLSDGGQITGSQSNVLTLTDVSPSLVGSYFVTVQNSETSQHTSSVAYLDVM